MQCLTQWSHLAVEVGSSAFVELLRPYVRVAGLILDGGARIGTEAFSERISLYWVFGYNRTANIFSSLKG